MRMLLLALFVCLPVFACEVSYETNCVYGEETPIRVSAKREALRTKSDINAGKIRERVEQAFTAIINRAAIELNDRGEWALADRISTEWQTYKYAIYDARNVGDHPSQFLNQWIATTYYKIEFILGRDVCVSTHIADLQSLNAEFRIVIHPSTFPMDLVKGDRCVEYKRHLCGGKTNDDQFHGLAPIITYWGITIGCLAGGIPLGGLIGTVGETLMERWLCPKISDKICKKALVEGDEYAFLGSNPD